jgi:hypothetical protein
MKDWDYKVYRCEWRIVLRPVGQYGEHQPDATVLAYWPTFEDAVIDIPNWAIEYEYAPGFKRWVPKVGNDGYNVISIGYKEVEVPYIPGK